MTICRPTKSVITHCFASASCVLAQRQAPSLTRIAFARAFLSALTGKAPNEAAPARVSAMALHVGLAYGLFAKLAEISRNEPLSYQRDPKKR